MFSVVNGIRPKRAALLKALLYSGWAPNEHASKPIEDRLVLEKDRYRFTVRPEKAGFFKTDRHAKHFVRVVDFNYGQYQFEREPFTISIKTDNFHHLTVNLRQPKDFTISLGEDPAGKLNRARDYLRDYVEKHGRFSWTTPFKKWMQKEFGLTYNGASVLFELGTGTHWKLQRVYKATIRCQHVIPTYKGR